MINIKFSSIFNNIFNNTFNNIFNDTLNFLKYPNLSLRLTLKYKSFSFLNNGVGFYIFVSASNGKLSFRKFRNAYSNMSRRDYYITMKENKETIRRITELQSSYRGTIKTKLRGI